MTAATHDGSALADDLLRRIGDAVGDRAKASAVFGEAVERGGATVIPVARARYAFGGGGGTGARGEGEGSGGGGGGAAVVTPVGYIELRDGRAEFKRITTAGDAFLIAGAVAAAAIALRALLG